MRIYIYIHTAGILPGIMIVLIVIIILLIIMMRIMIENNYNKLITDNYNGWSGDRVYKDWRSFSFPTQPSLPPIPIHSHPSPPIPTCHHLSKSPRGTLQSTSSRNIMKSPRISSVTSNINMKKHKNRKNNKPGGTAQRNPSKTSDINWELKESEKNNETKQNKWDHPQKT